jgi:hypothetical protein
MNRLACSLGALLLCLAATVAAPVPFPKPSSAQEHLTLAQLERQLRERGVEVADVKPAGPKTWVVTFPEFRMGCGVGGPFKGNLQVNAPDRIGAIRAFLQWYRDQEEQRLRKLRALGVIE